MVWPEKAPQNEATGVLGGDFNWKCTSKECSPKGELSAAEIPDPNQP